MPLRNKCILEVDLRDSDGDLRTAAFAIREDLNDTSEVTRQFLLGQRGQYLRKIWDIGSDILPDDIADALPEEIATADLENRKGYHIDEGAGEYSFQLSGKISADESPWGDGSAAAGDYNKYDASGENPLIVKKQIFDWAMAQTQSDSRGSTRLYLGEWSDGTYAESAGVFGEPLAVAIPESSVTNDPDDPSALEVTLTCRWTALLPKNAIQDTLDEAAELIPDY